MKRILLIGLALLTAAACRKITPEQRIDDLSAYFTGRGSTHADWLQNHDADKRLDYLTLTLARTLKATDLWTLDTDTGTSLVAEFPGSVKGAEAQLTLVSASLGDPVACGAALDVFEAFRALKIRPRNTIRLLFYEPAADSTGLTGLAAVNREFRASSELITFDIELSCRDTLPLHTFILEEKPLFVKQMIEVLPPYFKKLGTYSFIQGVYPNADWPLKASTYRYRLDEGALDRETAAVATLIFLLN